MRLISHRGNINGIIPQNENTKKYIENAILSGYDVEVDIRYINNQLFLGHDEPIEKIDFDWLSKKEKFLWIHCKNIEALIFLKESLNCFYHTTEDYVLTSRGDIWSFSGIKLYKNIIAVLPENHNYDKKDLEKCYGICSDEINRYKL